jgi:hypothetical protein
LRTLSDLPRFLRAGRRPHYRPVIYPKVIRPPVRGVTATYTRMPREKPKSAEDKKRRSRSYQVLFLALTLIVMIVIILTAKDLITALIIIGLIANFFIISSQLTLLSDRHMDPIRDSSLSVMVNPDPGVISHSGMISQPDKKEGFTMATTAPPGAGPPSFPNIPKTSEAGMDRYPGAIEFGKTNVGDEAPALGHVDWEASDRDGVPVGNPFDPNRVASPQAASPCVDDDAIQIYDGDELNTYQVRSRNQPERVWAGIYRRKAMMDKYLREELDESENTRWWGAHEV